MLTIPRARLAAASSRAATSASRKRVRAYAKPALAHAPPSDVDAPTRKAAEPLPPPPPAPLSRPREHEKAPADTSEPNASQSEQSGPPLASTSTYTVTRSSPAAQRVWQGFMTALGLNRPKHLAGRRTRFLYYKICAQRAEEEYDFWKDECHLPPTLQSWFTITNLHVWLLTTRLRALPAGVGEHHVQATIDHFFLDVEARIRDVCATDKRPLEHATRPPESEPSVLNSGAPEFADADGFVRISPLLAERRRARSYYSVPERGPHMKPAPEAFISRQMKILREQYNGLTLALDLGLAHNSDAELAGAIWRNLLGARGKDGIAYPGSDAEAAVRTREDDGSGVREFVDRELEAYVKYPDTMLTLVEYIRREIWRLSELPDEVWIAEPGIEDLVIEFMLFGPIRPVYSDESP